MTKAEKAVARARALVGTRFVPQGREPAVGLDCLGLMLLAFDIGPAGMRDDYRLSGPHREPILHAARAGFRRVSRRRLKAGDMLLLRPAERQWHLGLWTGNGLIHADLAARKVVERPGAPQWPVAAALRRRVRLAEGS